VRRWHRISAPEQDVEAFLSDVAAACRTGGYGVVFAADDIETLALSAGRERLPSTLPLAPHEQVLRSIDKLSLTRAAAHVGLAVPETTEVGEKPWEALEYPLVVKSRLHWTPGAEDAPRHLLRRFAADAAAARHDVAEIEACGGAAVLQQVITGPQIAMSLVMDESGETRAVVQQRSELQTSDGPSIRASTTPIDGGLLAGVQRLLRELLWTGLANVQFLVGPDGVPRLIDLNGRFYGSLALAIAAGADLPATWTQVAMGRGSGPCRLARPGVRFTWFERDLERVRRLDRGRARELAGAARYALGAVHQTWSPTDPLPTAVALAERLPGRRRVNRRGSSDDARRAARTRSSSAAKTESTGAVPSTDGTPNSSAAAM
jgi:predicted ATP-grasp superfamily ATP-dependent carboligase